MHVELIQKAEDTTAAMRRIDRPIQKFCFSLWGIGAISANLLMEGHDKLSGFQGQPLGAKVGAVLGLVLFVVAMLFSAYLLLISRGAGSVQKALTLFPWAPRRPQSATVFRIACAIGAAVFLQFSFLFAKVVVS